MIYTLIFKDLAIKDAGEIYIWYEDKGEKLSDQFIDELESCIEKIRLHPMAFQRKSGNYRSSFLRKFPYEVCYRVKGTEVIILAIYHASRNPKRKLRRT